MTRWEYYKRWVTTAVKNTTVRTGATLGTVVYSLVGILCGSLVYVLWNGADKLFEEWLTWIAFSVVGGIAVWSLAMFLMMIAAPFQMHSENQRAYEESKRTAEFDFKQRKDEMSEMTASIVRERDSLKEQMEDGERRKKLRSFLAGLRDDGVELFKRPIPEPQHEMDEQLFVLQRDAHAWTGKVRSELQERCEKHDVSRFDDPHRVNADEMHGRNGLHKECRAMIRGHLLRLDEMIDRLHQPTDS